MGPETGPSPSSRGHCCTSQTFTQVPACQVDAKMLLTKKPKDQSGTESPCPVHMLKPMDETPPTIRGQLFTSLKSEVY